MREQLEKFLTTAQAHLTLHDVLDDFPFAVAGTRPAGLPHSAWELVEHLRIAQRDILDFSRSAEHYKPLDWPADYWPKSPGPPNEEAWNASIAAIFTDLDSFLELLRDPNRDLDTPFPWGDGQTLLREALLIADHSAYHLGQLVLVRKALESAAPPAVS